MSTAQPDTRAMAAQQMTRKQVDVKKKAELVWQMYGHVWQYLWPNTL
jgi:hypothetical protein